MTQQNDSVAQDAQEFTNQNVDFDPRRERERELEASSKPAPEPEDPGPPKVTVPASLQEVYDEQGEEGVRRMLNTAAEIYQRHEQEIRQQQIKQAHENFKHVEIKGSDEAFNKLKQVMERGAERLGPAIETQAGQEKLQKLQFMAMEKIFADRATDKAISAAQAYLQNHIQHEKKAKSFKKTVKGDPDLAAMEDFFDELIEEGHDPEIVAPQLKRTIEAVKKSGLIGKGRKNDEDEDDTDYSYADIGGSDVDDFVTEAFSGRRKTFQAGHRSAPKNTKKKKQKEDEGNSALFAHFWGPRVVK